MIVRLVTLSFFIFSVSLAANIPAMVMTCTACHGATGVSPNPMWPNLMGQKKDYLKKQLMAFKTKERSDPLMNPIASNLSETDMEAAIQYFSNLK
jgi:cytochrome c553